MPDSVDSLLERFHIREPKKQDSKNAGGRWDFMWTQVGDEHREKSFGREALSFPTWAAPAVDDQVLSHIAEGAVKVGSSTLVPNKSDLSSIDDVVDKR